MAALSGSDRYTRLESFLDNLDQVRDPANLEEPFRSLWLRAHGELPTLMSEDDFSSLSSSDLGSSALGGVEITSSEGIDMKKIGSTTSSRIEVVSPKDVGPTIEMKVEDRKVTFKAAGEQDIKVIKAKEEAAQKVVRIQKLTAPLKGIGGEAARISDNVKEMLLHYKDGSYDKVVSASEEIEKKITSEEFKKGLIVRLQKKMEEYDSIGGNMTVAKERFREMTQSLGDDEKFYMLAQAANRLAEDAVKDLVTVEEVVVAEVERKEAPKPEMKTKEAAGQKEEAPRIVRKRKELPGDTEEEAPEVETEAEPKPVIKIIKKKVVVVRKHDEPENPPDVEEQEDFSIDLDEEEEEEDDHGPVPRVDEVVKMGKAGEVPKAGEAKHQPSVKASQGPSEEDRKKAFEKYKLVYNAAIKLHQNGKDVSKIFELYNIGEKSRQDGNYRMYVGIADQLQNMLISMQK
ncbi:MAG: hypothetical protein ACMUIE_08305 [Thermoplasmatota archaeon]